MTNPMRMPCDEWAEKLATQEEALSPADRAALAAHLAICPVCSLALTDYQMMRRLLPALPVPAFPAGLPPGLLHLWEEEDGNKLNEGETHHSFSLSVESWFQIALQDREQIKSNELSPETVLSSSTSSPPQEEVPADQTLQCSVCGQDFLFTASDQAFFLQRGYTEKPKRCPSCLRTRMHDTMPLDQPHRPHEKQQ
ncbi:MAG: zinc-ribbon domain-containing protein [Chloroflexota bacterium]|nr:zinc-ribbon domain-containing protein [Chloroflexota bacterium]